MAQSDAFCRARGARLTPIRRRVLELLHGFDKPLGAYDLVELLGSQGHRMAPITVYRALDFLIEQGLAHRLASRNAYIVSSNVAGDRTTTAFLICEACGDVNEIASPGLGLAVKFTLTAAGEPVTVAPFSDVTDASFIPNTVGGVSSDISTCEPAGGGICSRPNPLVPRSAWLRSEIICFSPARAPSPLRM